MGQDVGAFAHEAKVPSVKGEIMRISVDKAGGSAMGVTSILAVLQLAYCVFPALRHLALYLTARPAATTFCAVGAEPLCPSLIVIVVVEAVAGRGIDAVGVIKQEAGIADTAGLADELAVDIGVLAGCRAGTGFIVGI